MSQDFSSASQQPAEFDFNDFAQDEEQGTRWADDFTSFTGVDDVGGIGEDAPSLDFKEAFEDETTDAPRELPDHACRSF